MFYRSAQWTNRSRVPHANTSSKQHLHAHSESEQYHSLNPALPRQAVVGLPASSFFPGLGLSLVLIFFLFFVILFVVLCLPVGSSRIFCYSVLVPFCFLRRRLRADLKSAPTVVCTSRAWHPNIDLHTGLVSLPILSKDWRPVLSINTVVFALQLMFIEPTEHYAVNKPAAAALSSNPDLFREQVCLHVVAASF